MQISETEQERRRFCPLVTLTIELGFAVVGEWIFATCRTKLDCPSEGIGANRNPSVYIIASVDAGNDATVLYVGKASNGWRNRRLPHIGNRDRRFHYEIEQELRADRKVLVLEKASGWIVHAGFRASTNDPEEAALMARFCPPINKPSDVGRALRFQIP